MKKDSSSKIAFTTVDALDGLFRLEKRPANLRGSVPLRALQACVPLLEGNAFGFQIHLTERWRLERGRFGWSLALPPEEEARLLHRYAQAKKRLLAAGYLQQDDPWYRALEREVLFAQPLRRFSRRPRLRIWTGHLVRPASGVCLRLLAAANRRSHSFTVEEQVLYDAKSFVPLIVDLTLAAPAQDARAVVVGGELGCLAPLPATVQFVVRTLSERPEVGRAHLEFYSADYFQKKEAAPTRRYRKRIDTHACQTESTSAACEVVLAGPTEYEMIRSQAGAPHENSESVEFANLCDFSFRFDGANVTIDCDKQVLLRKGKLLRQRFTDAYGAEFVRQHEGGLLYFSKYFTTHPTGEPHFFVKPWAFVCTPPGWSSLVEGSHGDGYDVLRGVIATDQFHATPAVFAIHRADCDITVPAGTALLRIFALPRSLLHAGFASLPLPQS